MLSKENLINCFEIAKKENAEMIGVLVEVKENELPELIVNPNTNFDGKLEYYKKTYDDNLNHKFADGIKIVGFTHADTLQEVGKLLLKG
ncbi:hypothetical protein [Orenia marismortui]|uniref:hypothetical protein n=1 Tax=Orenia marismortui TaxID=46469 RepID=UPI000366B049|nr:hypothetical protein [Orenia marismortui]